MMSKKWHPTVVWCSSGMAGGQEVGHGPVRSLPSPARAPRHKQGTLPSQKSFGREGSKYGGKRGANCENIGRDKVWSVVVCVQRLGRALPVTGGVLQALHQHAVEVWLFMGPKHHGNVGQVLGRAGLGREGTSPPW